MVEFANWKEQQWIDGRRGIITLTICDVYLNYSIVHFKTDWWIFRLGIIFFW